MLGMHLFVDLLHIFLRACLASPAPSTSLMHSQAENLAAGNVFQVVDLRPLF